MTVGDAARVLMVCTGNICRSPAAERLARHLWAAPDRIDVVSAGTGALIGEPINLTMAHELLLDGIDTRGFAARQLDPREAEAADLVLGMTARHRRSVVGLAPAATKRTFALREFARLVATADGLGSADPGDRLRELVEHAGRNRSPGVPGVDDIADPYGRGTEDYASAYEAIKRAILVVARALRPAEA